MYENDNPISQLVHLYVDGAFNRRELVTRVAKKTGSLAAALAALAGYEELNAAPDEVGQGVRTTADDPEIEAMDVTFQGTQTAAIYAYAAWPKTREMNPGVLVVHENRGLVEHIKDVTRRVAKAGFVGLAVDLLSRQGGVQAFPDPAQQTAAYNRTTPYERRSDLIDGLDYLKKMPQTIHNRIGMTGFCAGGGNTWDFAVNIEELMAAVPFYGVPPAVEDLARIRAATLCLYAERDRALTQRLFPVATQMIQLQKSFGMVVYEGVGHAFHNDTGAAYNAEAAGDAWRRTIAWFNKFLRA